MEAKIALENAQENLIEYSRTVEEEMMPYAVLEREIEKLDAEQQNSVVMFVRFLVSQKTAAAPLAEPRAKALHRVADENAPQWLDEISGIASLPRGKSDTDLVYDAIANFAEDFEDEVQYRAALAAGADIIVTRDKPGFVNAAIPVMSPTELLRSI